MVGEIKGSTPVAEIKTVPVYESGLEPNRSNFDVVLKTTTQLL